MAPIVLAMAEAPDFEPRVISTGQHREMLNQTLAVFGIRPDRDLDLMRPGSTLSDALSRHVAALDVALADERPDFVLVQGDTTTVLAGALAAAYRRIPLGHVEAGLRVGTLDEPFPEEINRRATTPLATLHFAPTRRAAENLYRENVPRERVFVTGNTVVDALGIIAGRLGSGSGRSGSVTRTILVTLHRRENLGEPMAEVCRALRDIIDRFDDVEIVFPMHRNPAVREVIGPILGDHPRVRLVEPLDYVELIGQLRDAYVCVTDSGGIQEEAPTFGTPVLVARATTERPEAIEAGCARLVGTARIAVRSALMELLSDAAAREKMARVGNPFGDGHAAARILDAIRRYFSGRG